MKDYGSIDEYIADHPDQRDKVLGIAVAGESVNTPFSRQPCVYFEAAVLFLEGDRPAGHTGSFKSDSPFTIVIDNTTRVTIDGSLRLYLSPTYLKRYDASTVPDEDHREILESSGHEAIADAEFVLIPEKIYFARISRESYHLPPMEHGGPPTPAGNTVTCISDSDFTDESYLDRATPLSHWTY